MISLPPSLLSGMLVGFLVTAPVGPICILCIQRSLTYGYHIGIASGFGSAIALSLYGILGAMGVAIIAHMSLPLRLSLAFVGAGILTFIGWKILRSLPASQGNIIVDVLTFPRASLSTFILEIVNPASMMIFVGLFASMQKAPAVHAVEFAEIGLGIFLSSMAWWIFLSLTISCFRSYFSHAYLLWLNRISGVVIIILGLRPLIVMLWS